MKTIAYTALLYGCDYLAYAIRSVIDSVDEMWILYSPHGSHGSQTTLPCPDSRADLYAIAQAAAGRKLHWVDGNWTHEGEQRDSIYQYAPDTDVILVLDSDEVWGEYLAQTARTFYEAWEIGLGFAGQDKPFRYLRFPFIHFYRNFYSAIVNDPAYPIRVIYPKIEWGEYTYNSMIPISHFGYCQRSEVIRYKMHIHGHKNELRCSPDEYVDDYYLNLNRTRDLHPVGSQYWNIASVNPLDYLPTWMMEHPYAYKALIE